MEILISGITIIRNADTLYFPFEESVLSALPLVDEFLIGVAAHDADDRTDEIVARLAQHPKVKLFTADWDIETHTAGSVFSVETNKLMDHCRGRWILLLQADEVLHEADLGEIRRAAAKYATDARAEGFLFQYRHFWGDYGHWLPFQGWYQQEIRMVKNAPGVRNVGDGQSFRNAGQKLHVRELAARIFHYGWVRPPERMLKKKLSQERIYQNTEEFERYRSQHHFHYGDVQALPEFTESHPGVMEKRISELWWQDEIQQRNHEPLTRPRFKHEKRKYRLISRINRLFGTRFFAYRNWINLGRA